MDVDEKHTENSIVITNMPARERDEEDVRAMCYIGLCLDTDEIEFKEINRAKSKMKNKEI